MVDISMAVCSLAAQDEGNLQSGVIVAIEGHGGVAFFPCGDGALPWKELEGGLLLRLLRKPGWRTERGCCG